MYKLACIIGLLICFSSCHKIAYISLFNKTNDSLRIYCHYNINDRIDSVYIYPNDSCHLGFWGAFQSYENLKIAIFIIWIVCRFSQVVRESFIVIRNLFISCSYVIKTQ